VELAAAIILGQIASYDDTPTMAGVLEDQITIWDED